MKYIVADYYPAFACKCGDCRANCCVGWPVTISRREYDRMMDAPCSEDFRQEIKEALRQNFAPDEERYAHIVHDKHARCRLLGEDGLCSLQKAAGEGVLPDVCRLYPRNRRSVCGIAECALSLSCEGVMESVLFSRDQIRFMETEIGEEPLFSLDMSPAQYAECQRALEIMGDRDKTIPERFAALGEELFGCKERCGEEEGQLDAVRVLYQLASDFSGKNKVAGPLCMEALRFFGMSGKEKLSREDAAELVKRYREAEEHVFSGLDGWQDAAERLIVTHMFYNNFPHVGGTNDGERAFYGLAAICAFVKFIFTGNLCRWEGREDMADVLADLFRLIEHSDFKYRASQAYRRQAEFSPGCWRQLVEL